MQRSSAHRLTLALMALAVLSAAAQGQVRPEASGNVGQSGPGLRATAWSMAEQSSDRRFGLHVELNAATGAVLHGAYAAAFGSRAAAGVLFSLGARSREVLVNTGLQIDEVQRLHFSAGHLQQRLDFDFISGRDDAWLGQSSLAASYRRHLGRGLLNSLELAAYLANAPSRQLSEKTYGTETPALFELWSDPRRVAGGRLSGWQARLQMSPLQTASVNLGAGGERLVFDQLTGKAASSRAVATAHWTQQLDAGVALHLGAQSTIASERWSLGFELPFGGGRAGVDLSASQGRQGLRNDASLRLSWSHPLGEGGAVLGRAGPAAADGASKWASLVEEAARRPQLLPSQVLARLDATAAPTRLVAINKAALPAGSTIDPATGAVRVPLGVAVLGVQAVTRNASPFANGSQFAASGSHLIVQPAQLSPPAVGAVDLYVVTVSNVDGGTTLVTMSASRGSVQIDSIVVSPGAFPPPALGSFALLSKTYGDAPFDLVAPTSSSNGAFTFSSSNPAVATVNGHRVTIVGIGATTLTATQAAAPGYAAATTATTLTVAPRAPTLGGFAPLAKQRSDAPFTLATPSSDSPGAFTFTSSNPAVATLAGRTVTLTGAGTTVLIAQQAATGPYLAGSIATTLTVNGVAPTFSSFAALNKNFGEAPFALAPPSSNSAGAFSFTSSNAAVATVSGATVTLVGAGVTTITASQAASGGFLGASTTATLTVAAVAPMLGGFAPLSKTFGDAPFGLTAPSSNSAGAFSYASSNTAVATVSGSTVTVVGVGTATITATQAAAGGHLAGTLSTTLTVTAGVPTLSGFAAVNKTFGDPAFALTAPSSNSGGAFTYTSSNAAVATVSGATVTVVGVGTSTITATQAASGNFSAGTTSATLTVNALAPTLANFNAITKTWGDPAFTLAAPTSNSAGAFSYTSSNPAVASISGNTVTLVGAGGATITATQAAAGNYAAGSINANLTVTGTAPTLGAFANLNKTFGDAAFALTAPASNSPGAFSYTSSNPAVATVSGSTVTIIGAGTTTIAANQANAGAFYAASATATLTVAAIAPTLGSFAAINKSFGDAPFALVAPGSNSAGAFSYTSSNAAVATVSGNTVTITGVGSATITATQAAAGGYSSGAAPTTLTVGLGTPTLSGFGAITKTYGDGSFNLTAPSSNSAGSFSYSSSNTAVATVSGSTVAIVGVGTSTITATQAAAGNFGSAALGATLTVNGIAPTLGSFNAISTTYGTLPFALAAPSSNSAGSFSFTSSNTAVATVSGNTVTIVGAGVSTLTATQAAAGNYAAASATTTLTVSGTAPSLGGFTAMMATYGAAPFTLATPSSNSPGAFSYSSSNTAVATVSGNTVTIVGVGPTVITATQAAAGVYDSGSIAATLMVNPLTPSYGSFTLAAKTYGDGSFTLSPPSSTSAAPFTYTSSNPAVALVSGSNVSLLGAGSASITALQGASGNHGPGSTSATLVVATATPTLGGFADFTKAMGEPHSVMAGPTTNSPGAITYNSSNPAVATLSGATLQLVGVGTTTITATQAAAGSYHSAFITTTLTVVPGTPTLGGFGALGKTFGDAAFSLTAPTSPSAGNFSYSSSNAAVATVSGNTVTIVGVGSTTLTATQAAAGDYLQGSTNATLTVAAAAPTLGGFSAVIKNQTDAPFSLTPPTSNSAGSFSYTSSNSAVATVSGNTVTLTGVGTSTITATQAAAGNYTSASTTLTLTVNSSAPSLGSFGAINKTYGDAAFALAAPSSNSAGSFSYASSNTAVATVSGSTVTLVGAGSATITATQAAAGAYSSGSTSATLTVAKATPTIGPIANLSFTSAQYIGVCISTVDDSCYVPPQWFEPYAVNFGPALNGTTNAADLGPVPGGLGRNGLRSGDTLTSSDGRISGATAGIATGPSLSLMAAVTFNFPGWPGSAAPIVSTMTLTRAATANFNAASTTFTVTVTPTNSDGVNACFNNGLMVRTFSGPECQCTPEFLGAYCTDPNPDFAKPTGPKALVRPLPRPPADEPQFTR